jgi:AcrR family transcriptional regulator
MRKPSRQTGRVKEGMKMKELAELSGVSKSTIHYYLNMGLLHPPHKIGLNLTIYDWTHLSRVKRIRQLKEEHKLPLSRIKEILSEEKLPPAGTPEEHETKSLIRSIEEEKKTARNQRTDIKREEIIDAAIAVFSKKGYEKTTIEAIADSLHMGKSTIYLYFESKEDLFMECIERLTVVAVPEESWDEIRKERDCLRRQYLRLIAFLKAFPSYSGILTMARASLGGENRKLAEKAKETLSLMVRPMAKDLRRAMNAGTLRDTDAEFIAHLMLAMGEGIGSLLLMDSRYTLERSLELYSDFLAYGITKQGAEKRDKAETGLYSGEVTDLQGIKTVVENIRFGDFCFFPGTIGKAEVQIDPGKVQEIRFLRQDSLFCAQVTSKDGRTVTAEVNEGLVLSGDTHYGRFTIELKNVDTISFAGHNAPRVSGS